MPMCFLQITRESTSASAPMHSRLRSGRRQDLEGHESGSDRERRNQGEQGPAGLPSLPGRCRGDL